MPKCRVKRHSVTQPFNQSYRLIPLTQGQNAIVDAKDFEFLSQWNWTAERQRNSFYCVRKDGTKRLYMHHALFPDIPEIDHQNGNGLDNRRQNLRPCSHAQNIQNCGKRSHNKSGFKGVCWYESRGWRARITVNHKVITLGYFSTAEEAARHYDDAALKFHGAFASLNFQRPNLR